MKFAIAEKLELTSLPGLGGLLGFIGLPSRRSSKQDFSSQVQDAVSGTISLINGYLLQALEATDKKTFEVVRDEVFPDYANLLFVLARLANVVIPAREIERISRESFAELESEFKLEGLDRFGASARDQVVFTIWTLRRTEGLLSKIHAADPSTKEKQEADQALAREFSVHAAWTQFHLGCLTTALRADRSVQPEVLDEIQGGLRAVVNAYGLARQGVLLRDSHQEPLIFNPEWDAEDKELLDSSMRDIAAETY